MEHRLRRADVGVSISLRDVFSGAVWSSLIWLPLCPLPLSPIEKRILLPPRCLQNSAFVHTAVKGAVAAHNPLIVGGYSEERDGPVVFSGVGHAAEDDNYLVTKVK